MLLPSLDVWLVCAAAVLVGTVLQRLSGAGFGMVATPIVTLFAEFYVPASILLLGCIFVLGSAFSTRSAGVQQDLLPGFLGRFFGAVIAAFIATLVVGSPLLPIVVSCVVLVAVALNLVGLSFDITPRSLFIAGTAGGVMGTLTGVGAAPMAILYSRIETRRSAASQNTFFGFGMIVSILALGTAGLIQWPHLGFAVSLVPIAFMGFLIARPLAGRFERKSIRPWALGLATISALVLLVRSGL